MKYKLQLCLILLCLMLSNLMQSTVLAYQELRIPYMGTRNNHVADQTGLISPRLIYNIETFAGFLHKTYNIDLQLFVVPFTDSLTMDAFVEKVFQRSAGYTDSAVLVLSIGDEKWGWKASEAYKNKIGTDFAQITSQANKSFTKQEYSQALSEVYTALSNQIASKLGYTEVHNFPHTGDQYDGKLVDMASDFKLQVTDYQKNFKSTYTGLTILCLLYVGTKLGRYFGLSGMKLFFAVFGLIFLATLLLKTLL